MESASDRPEYASKVELLLSLVGYAVGLGNIWRFPYLVYTYGGGPFLIPYFVCLALLGLPLFILEMGLGQIYRQGTLGIWEKMGVPKFRGVGAAATIGSFFVGLYYNVILAWTTYYLGRTIFAIPQGILPWSDKVPGFTCPDTVLFPSTRVASKLDLVDPVSGLFNPSYQEDFWCPATGIPTVESAKEVPAGFVMHTVKPTFCPARAAAEFWSSQALQQSSGLDDLGGFNYGMLASFAFAWVIVYFCVYKGVQSSGKVVYVTATLPYAILVIFFIRAITLENASSGVAFYLQPDFSKLWSSEVWLRAANQIFYSLGVGFGSIIAFASYAPNRTKSNFVLDATAVSFINCGTSFFAGFVVFPVLGYLAHELSTVNPCIQSNDLRDLAQIGLSGSGLAFIAFPIAISQMPGSFIWALMFFIMIFCLGIDSQFAMVESVMTVLSDAKVAPSLSKPQLAGAVCGISFLIGLIFVTRGGIYWFTLFDYYSCLAVMFVVCMMECIGVTWSERNIFRSFAGRVEEVTGWSFGITWEVLYRYVNPILLAVLVALCLTTVDVMGARGSKRYPEGSGYLPEWSIYAGWALALTPIIVGAGIFATTPPAKDNKSGESYGSVNDC